MLPEPARSLLSFSSCASSPEGLLSPLGLPRIPARKVSVSIAARLGDRAAAPVKFLIPARPRERNCPCPRTCGCSGLL